jgi:hypothetical protein
VPCWRGDLRAASAIGVIRGLSSTELRDLQGQAHSTYAGFVTCARRLPDCRVIAAGGQLGRIRNVITWFGNKRCAACGAIGELRREGRPGVEHPGTPNGQRISVPRFW